MGIFDDDHKDLFSPQSDAEVSNSFLAHHVRKQLSYDLWWLFFAAWVICIVERAQLQDSSKSTWFTIFSIMFEVVSGYGTVGISLGVPFVCFVNYFQIFISSLPFLERRIITRFVGPGTL